MKNVNRTTTPTPAARGATYIKEVLARLSAEDLEALKAWRRLADDRSPYLGGPGRSEALTTATELAWDALSPAARSAYLSVLHTTRDDLLAAIYEAGVPDHVVTPVDAVYALLGLTYPGLQILSLHELAIMYRYAVEEAEEEESV